MSELLLNLSTSINTSSKHPSTKVKGGRWTERVKANKQTQKRKNRSAPELGDNSHKLVSERSRKRPRDTSDTAEDIVEEGVQPKRAKSSGGHPGSFNTIISSLFTSNPTINLPSPLTKLVSAPSNAPLSDASMFSELGLDPLLVSHLEHKMNILKPTSIQRASIPFMTSPDPTIAQRDIFIQSQTGSGKTLTFLLPIIQDLLPLSRLSYIDRSIGTLAIVIAPTRELAKQISDVLDALLQLRLRSYHETPDAEDPQSPRLTRWLVSGLFTGGSTRSHEKARIRKGLPIIVSTPGRLLDHLQHTSSLDVGKCRWLILDEADRLLELGFRETIDGILKNLDGRRKLALQSIQDGSSQDVGDWDWSRERRTVLCSATIKEDVQDLAGQALKNPLFVTSKQHDDRVSVDSHGDQCLDTQTPTIPAQLTQNYIIVPLKLRLVTLVALLRSTLSQKPAGSTAKTIVFFSCTDSVDFHFSIFKEVEMKCPQNADPSSEDGDSEVESESSPHAGSLVAKSAILPSASVYKLHGSMPTADRKASLKLFNDQTTPSILLCTSVASRGLDLPSVQAVVQYDLPTENGHTEYIHRVGRTARAGQRGEAWSFVSPSEAEWPTWIDAEHHKTSGKGLTLQPNPYEAILQDGFDGDRNESQSRATEVQLAFERSIILKPKVAESARKAFYSHVRAYATHPTAEKHIFHVRNLHLGHLAKAFALREAPSEIKKPSKIMPGSRWGSRHRLGVAIGKKAPKGTKNQVTRIRKPVNLASEFQIANVEASAR